MATPTTPTLTLRLLATQSDARLVALARLGHERAFEALVQRYRKQLLGYARRRLLLPESRAEDALQQAFLSAWLALQNGTEVTDPRAWLYRITHNAGVSALRRSGYDYDELTDAFHGAEAPDGDLERRAVVRQTLIGLAGLPELQRQGLLRTAVEGESYERVAAALGVTEPALRGLVYRARVTLRAAATAIAPTPLVTWLATGGESAPLAARFAEAVAGVGGSAGLAGLVLKGGAVVVSAGAIAGGGALLPSTAPQARSPAPAVVASRPPPTGTLVVSRLRTGPGGRSRDGSRAGSRRDRSDEHASSGSGSTPGGRGSTPGGGSDSHGGPASGPGSGSGLGDGSGSAGGPASPDGPGPGRSGGPGPGRFGGPGPGRSGGSEPSGDGSAPIAPTGGAASDDHAGGGLAGGGGGSGPNPPSSDPASGGSGRGGAGSSGGGGPGPSGGDPSGSSTATASRGGSSGTAGGPAAAAGS